MQRKRNTKVLVDIVLDPVTWQFRVVWLVRKNKRFFGVTVNELPTYFPAPFGSLRSGGRHDTHSDLKKGNMSSLNVTIAYNVNCNTFQFAQC